MLRPQLGQTPEEIWFSRYTELFASWRDQGSLHSSLSHISNLHKDWFYRDWLPFQNGLEDYNGKQVFVFCMS